MKYKDQINKILYKDKDKVYILYALSCLFVALGFLFAVFTSSNEWYSKVLYGVFAFVSIYFGVLFLFRFWFNTAVFLEDIVVYRNFFWYS